MSPLPFAVLGASSFSGRALCENLRRRGIGYMPFARPGFDINRDQAELVAAIAAARCSTVVNFVALNMVAESWEYATQYYRTNVVALAELVERLRPVPTLRKFVQVSTPEVYGDTDQVLYEDHPYRPSTPYAVSRAAADMNLMAYHKAYGFPVVFMRSVNVYGPGQQPYRIIPKTILCILSGRKLPLHGGGTSVRSFIHIADAMQAVFLAAAAGRAGEVYHTSTARQTSIRELVGLICAKMGARFEDVVEIAEERTGKDPAYLLDSSKARAELRWRDEVDLERGLDETIAWFRRAAVNPGGASLDYQHRP